MGAAFVVSFSPVDAYIWVPLAVHRHGAPALSLTLILTLTLSLNFQPLNCIADGLPNCVSH